MALQPAFIWGSGGQRMTPEEIARERQVLAALTGQTDTSPVGHWSQGATRLVDALGGVLDERRLDRAADQNAETNSSIMASLLGGMGGSSPVSPASSMTAAMPTSSPATGGGDMSSYRDAIASIESAGSGDYSAVGPTHPSLGRALGRYQVMEANIGPWSEAALGRAVTPDEFMASPELQDAIFDHQFSQYVNQYGPEGAAQAWFGGPGGVGKTGRSDSLGTTIGEYGQRFNAAVGGNASQPVQVAQSGGINPAIIEAMTSPYADSQTRQMAGILLEQQLQANDPMNALRMEQLQLQNEALRNPQPEQTAEMQNLSWRAQQAGLQPGSQEYSDFILSGGRGPETVVNVGNGAPELGKLSTDYGYVLDPQTGQPVIDPNTGLPQAAPVPGSAAARELQAQQDQAQMRQDQTARYGDVVTQDIDRVLGIMEDSSIPVTGAWSYLSAVPGTNARDVAGLLDTVRANIGFDRLQQMREASPTGGALGAVSEFENRLLQATLGNLEQSQSQEQFKRNLQRLRNLYTRVINDGISPEEADRLMAEPDGPNLTDMPRVEIPAGIDPEDWELLTDEERALWQ